LGITHGSGGAQRAESDWELIVICYNFWMLKYICHVVNATKGLTGDSETEPGGWEAGK
jgi:hypothetical protein